MMPSIDLKTNNLPTAAAVSPLTASINVPAIAKPPRSKLHRTIRRTSGWQAIDLRQLWQFRDLLVSLGVRDIKLRYRQTALGVVWVVLQPLLGAGVFSFVFGKVANLPTNGIPYFIFSYAGLLGWNVFQGTLAKTGSSLVANRHLVSKVFFPRLVLPLSSVFSTMIDFLVALVMMAVLMCIYHVVPSLGILLLPLWILAMMMLGLGFGLLAAGLMVTYRDVAHVLPVLTQFMLYASPVAYAVTAVPVRLRFLYHFNPLSGLLEAIRWSLFSTQDTPWGAVGYAVSFSVVIFLLGTLMFKSMERKFADVI